jgi:hypothetical protein
VLLLLLLLLLLTQYWWSKQSASSQTLLGLLRHSWQSSRLQPMNLQPQQQQHE